MCSVLFEVTSFTWLLTCCPAFLLLLRLPYSRQGVPAYFEMKSADLALRRSFERSRSNVRFMGTCILLYAQELSLQRDNAHKGGVHKNANQETITIPRCVGVWSHDRVEIIANEQGNRTTPSYVAFTDTERLCAYQACAMTYVCCSLLCPGHLATAGWSLCLYDRPPLRVPIKAET